jgi:hypothetical protein
MPINAPNVNEVEMKKRTAVGPTAGIFIILLLLVVGAIYAWSEQMREKEAATIRARATAAAQASAGAQPPLAD